MTFTERFRLLSVIWNQKNWKKQKALFTAGMTPSEMSMNHLSGWMVLKKVPTPSLAQFPSPLILASNLPSTSCVSLQDTLLLHESCA